jgi:hypothetical protein
MFHVEMEATSLCNTRCLHCPHETISRPAGRMDWETYCAVIEQIRGHVKGDRYSISFSGMGEPLLNPLICRFIAHVSGEATTSFASNGAALTEQNVSRLIEAGLDSIYLSFNGDEPGVFAEMMGGLSYDRILANVRRAVELARGSRLRLRANVSIAKANQDRVSRIKALLEKEEVGPVTFSLCHNRGGNLRDQNVCDTPPMEAERWKCDVMENTLFIDWQGKAHICDHDLHGDYQLGDLMTEPLALVLERRQKLLDDGSSLEICRSCNDIMKVGGTFPLASRAGGNFRDWVYYLFQDLDDPLSEANEAMKWIFRIYQKEGRADRFANRLLGIEKAAQGELREERRAREALAGELESVQRTLDDRDREFAALHAEYSAMRRDRFWRVASMLRNDLKRIRRLFGRESGG